ncbi:unnamed protein product [Closterium sp. NIES-53]
MHSCRQFALPCGFLIHYCHNLPLRCSRFISATIFVLPSTFYPSFDLSSAARSPKSTDAAPARRPASAPFRLLSAPVAALPLVLAFVEAELPNAMDTFTALSDFHITEPAFKAFCKPSLQPSFSFHACCSHSLPSPLPFSPFLSPLIPPPPPLSHYLFSLISHSQSAIHFSSPSLAPSVSSTLPVAVYLVPRGTALHCHLSWSPLLCPLAHHALDPSSPPTHHVHCAFSASHMRTAGRVAAAVTAAIAAEAAAAAAAETACNTRHSLTSPSPIPPVHAPTPPAHAPTPFPHLPHRTSITRATSTAMWVATAPSSLLTVCASPIPSTTRGPQPQPPPPSLVRAPQDEYYESDEYRNAGGNGTHTLAFTNPFLDCKTVLSHTPSLPAARPPPAALPSRAALPPFPPLPCCPTLICCPFSFDLPALLLSPHLLPSLPRCLSPRSGGRGGGGGQGGAVEGGVEEGDRGEGDGGEGAQGGREGGGARLTSVASREHCVGLALL